jgi:hypothetical protein
VNIAHTRCYTFIKLCIFHALVVCQLQTAAQEDTTKERTELVGIYLEHDTDHVPPPPPPIPDSSQLKPGRLWLVAGAQVAVWGASYLALNQAWYKDYPKQSFHFFNDRKEWNQMDKGGHLWTAYQVSRLSYKLWKWAGLSDKKSAVWGGISAVAYQSIIEIQDGFSTEWGFSLSDMEANLVGAAGFVVQQALWKDQRLQLKMSYWPYKYPDDLVTRRDQLFGESLPERLLKDYNAQTYWLSANMNAFFPHSGFPKWLNIAAGYGSDGMLGGDDNKWTDRNGMDIDRSDVPRVRRYYLSLDVDLTKIKTRSKFLRTAFYLLNAVKIPAPALEMSSTGKFSGHLLKF